MKEADAEWHIETFTQEKKHIADFLIEFMALASKAQTDDQHVIFLLKKNINREIVRAIIAYLPTQAPKSLEQWKVAITAVGQGYEWTNIRYDYRTSSGITYGGMGKPMEIEQQQNNGQGCKPKCYNCNKYGHIAKDCQQPKREKKPQGCFKCGKEGHIAIGCRAPQQMKTRSSQQEDSDNEEQKGFVKGLK